RFVTIDATGALVPPTSTPVAGAITIEDLPAATPARPRFDGFFGREREVAALREALDATRTLGVGAALVVGDAGLGKSVLVEHVLATVDAVVLRARSVEGAFA